MKLKQLSDLEEGELFFAYVNTQDGRDFRSFFKGKSLTNFPTILCNSTSDDKWLDHNFTSTQKVWA